MRRAGMRVVPVQGGCEGAADDCCADEDED